MEGSYFRNDLNPALAPTRGYLALPGMSGIGLNVSSNFLSVDNFLYKRDGQTVTALHGSVSADEFLGKLPKLGKLAVDTKVNILGVGFYAKKMFWTFGLNADVSADMSLSTDLFKALKRLGNGRFDLGNTALRANAYLDAYIGTSFRVHRNVNIGIKAKFLVGIATLDAQFSQLSADVSSDVVNATMRGAWHANGILFDNSQVKAGEQLPFDKLFVLNDINYWLNNAKNFGVAFDVGAEVRLLNDHLKISAAVTDLGFIKWTPNNYVAGELSGDFNFKGVNFETSEADIESNFEMLATSADAKAKHETMLNVSLNAGVEYNILRNHIAFGLLSHTKFCNTMIYTELTASANFRPTNWISATVSHTFLNSNRLGVFGAALNFHPAGINIYVGLDYFDPNLVVGPKAGKTQIYLPRYQKSFNVYAGVGFNFGRPRFIKEAAAQAKAEYQSKRLERRKAKRDSL
jgi:hypothetical protein